MNLLVLLVIGRPIAVQIAIVAQELGKKVLVLPLLLMLLQLPVVLLVLVVLMNVQPLTLPMLLTSSPANQMFAVIPVPVQKILLKPSHVAQPLVVIPLHAMPQLWNSLPVLMTHLLFQIVVLLIMVLLTDVL